MSEWIRCDERLPDDDDLVIAFNPDTEVTVSCWDEECRHWHYEDGARRLGVSHWMPLPEPPKDKP